MARYRLMIVRILHEQMMRIINTHSLVGTKHLIRSQPTQCSPHNMTQQIYIGYISMMKIGLAYCIQKRYMTERIAYIEQFQRKTQMRRLLMHLRTG